MKSKRTSRLMRLLGMLQNGRGQNTALLAAECGVSRRTIFRDIGLLRESGVPVEFDADNGRFSISGDCLLPATSFTPEEALAVVVLCHELGGRSGVPYQGPARTAALKLEANLPRPLREKLRQMSDAVRIQLNTNSRLHAGDDVYRQLIEALNRRQSVRIRYNSLAEKAEICTKLSPYRMLFSRHAWYVVGRSSVHRAVRTFHVGRIGKLEPLEDPYRIPRGFSIDRYLRNAWHLIAEKGPDWRVVVRFKPLVAQNVAEVLWHKTQRLTFHDDGALDFEVTVSGLHEISWWILGYGDQAEVLEPEELRELVAQRCRRALNQYWRDESSPEDPARRPPRRKLSAK